MSNALALGSCRWTLRGGVHSGNHTPYRELCPPYCGEGDLRNPKLQRLHNQIRKQFGLPKICKSR